MDTTGIVQLIIATILYSTLIAPSVKRMSDIKADISNISFPIRTDDSYASESEKYKRVIFSKLHQYSVVYSETRKFLWILYGAMFIVVASQLYPFVLNLIRHEPSAFGALVNGLITTAIFVLLIVAMNIFITKPAKLRTFRWLSATGIKPAYSNDLFSPALEVNSLGRNMRESNNHIHIKLSSGVALFGYNIILTIEDVHGSKLYHALAGRVVMSRYVGGGGTHYVDGSMRGLVDLVHSLSLKEGKYRVRLIIFQTVYQGHAKPSEVVTDIEVASGSASSEIVYLDMSQDSQRYSYEVHDDKPYGVEYDESAHPGAVATLLASRRFQKRFSTSRRVMFCLTDRNGAITTDSVERALHPAKYFLKRARAFFAPKSKKSFLSKHIKIL